MAVISKRKVMALTLLLGGCGGATSEAPPMQGVEPKAAIVDADNQWPTPIAYRQPGTDAGVFDPELTTAAVTRVANQVADWQLSQYDLRSNQMRTEGRASGLPQGWMYATWQIGLLAWADASQQADYEMAVRNNALVNEWLLGPRVYHADDHAMGAVYLSLFERAGGAYKIAHVKQTFDQVLAQPESTELLFDNDHKVSHALAGRHFIDPACTDRWCWADAIFMAPPVWAQMARVTGDSRYLSFMDTEFWHTTDYLYNAEQQLYLRDSRYFALKDDHGRLIYWGRGNGWVLAGLARILQEMPNDFPSRARYQQLFSAMSERLIGLQQADGSWPSSLLEVEKQSPPESSATGLLVYGLAWGLNHGLLQGERYDRAVTRGWQSLVASVAPDGKLGWVQQVAFAPGSATAEDTQLYGTGALLLAASEVVHRAREK